MKYKKMKEGSCQGFRLFIAGLCFLAFGQAQAQQIDNEQWTGIGLSQSFGNFQWSYEQQLRLRYGFAITDNYFHELGLKYKIVKGLQLKAGYRFGVKEPGIDPGSYQRLSLDLSYKYGFSKKFNLKFRTRLQGKYRLGDNGKAWTNYNRNKIQAAYRLQKKIWLKAAFEWFQPLNDYENGNLIDQNRYYLTLDWELMKRGSLEMFYIYKNAVHQSDPVYGHVAGVTFSYQLKKLKRKKKKKKKKSD